MDAYSKFRTSYHLTDATGKVYLCGTTEEFHATIAAIRQQQGPEAVIDGYAVVDDGNSAEAPAHRIPSHSSQ